MGGGGGELLAEAARVVGNESVGRLQNGGGGAVVLLEAEQLRVGVVAAELLQVLDARASPAVYGLIVIPHHERITGPRVSGRRLSRRRRLRRGEQLHPRILDGVGVLELIHQHVLETSPVV